MQEGESKSTHYLSNLVTHLSIRPDTWLRHANKASSMNILTSRLLYVDYLRSGTLIGHPPLRIQKGAYTCQKYQRAGLQMFPLQSNFKTKYLKVARLQACHLQRVLVPYAVSVLSQESLV